MKSLLKLGVLGVVVAFSALVAGTTLPTSAAPVSLTVNGSATTPQNPAVPSTNLVAGTYNDEGLDFTLTSSAATTVGYFLPGTFALTSNNEGQLITPNSATVPTQIVVADDIGDATPDLTGFQVGFYCAGVGPTTISYTQGVGPALSIVLNCTASTTITFSNNAPTVNTQLTVTAVCTAAGQQLTANGGAFSSTAPTNGTYFSPTQLTCAGAGNLIATYTCPATAMTVTFTLNLVNATLNCGAGTTTGGLVLSVTTGMGGTVSGTCPAAGSVLTQTGAAQFVSATINSLPVTVTAGSVNCTAAGPIVASFTCNYTGTSTAVQFALGAASATFYCSNTTGYYGGTYPYTQYPYNTTNCTPYNTGAYPYNQYNTAYNTNCYNQQQYTNVPTSLTVTSASPSVACGGTLATTVRVVGASGPVADGTTVSLSSSIGSFSPATATTTAGGMVQATFTAPANISATTATLKAISGAASNTATVSVTCAPAATAPSAPSTQPVYTSPPPPPSGAPVITPPSTGDAGLLAAIRDEECN